MRREWELEELIACWTLDEEEFALLANKSGATRLGFAVLLKYFEQEARFPRREDVPRAAVDFVAGGGEGGSGVFFRPPFSSPPRGPPAAGGPAGGVRGAADRAAGAGPDRAGAG